MCKKNTPASERNTPAAMATTAPLPSLLTLLVTSALASSISSRTMTVVRSATSPSVVAMFSGRGSGATASDQGCGHDAAQEGGADENLGMPVGERGRRAERGIEALDRGRRGYGRRRLRLGSSGLSRGGLGGRGLSGLGRVLCAHSGGSSPNTRRH